jgi:hypothetical protein
MKTDKQILEGVKKAREKIVKQEVLRIGEMRVSEWLNLINSKEMTFKEYQATMAILSTAMRDLPKINKVN